MKFTALSTSNPRSLAEIISEGISPEKALLKSAPLTAHPLYPANQVFLWLPGLPGQELPFCSCNEAPVVSVQGGIVASDVLHDREGNLYAPPFPVSPHSFVSWHTHVTPPIPFHPVPIKRFLTIAELEGLARKVVEVSGEQISANSHLLSILRNEYKSYILYFLAHMGVLEGVTPHRK